MSFADEFYTGYRISANDVVGMRRMFGARHGIRNALWPQVIRTQTSSIFTAANAIDRDAPSGPAEVRLANRPLTWSILLNPGRIRHSRTVGEGRAIANEENLLSNCWFWIRR
jgi:hypothetical protein